MRLPRNLLLVYLVVVGSYTAEGFISVVLSPYLQQQGVPLGQIGAIIYKNQVIYGIFADQAGGNFIGEASYKMCSLFVGANNCDPNNGGIDPLDVTYVTFTGTTPRASGADIYSHDKHTALGEAAASAWLGQ